MAMNEGFRTEDAVDIAGSNGAGTPPPPPYGSKTYWESRYRQFYFQYQKMTPPNSLSTEEEQSVETALGNNSKGVVHCEEILKNSADSNNGFVSHLHVLEGDDPLPGHEWYFSYEELRPLLLQELVDKLVDLIPKDERHVSLLEIGCGDAPIVPNLANDICIQTGVATKAIASDYSAAVIKYLKDQQQQTQGCSSRTALKESTEANICGTENHDKHTKDTKAAPLDPSLTNSRPRKRHKAYDRTHDVMIQYAVEDATNLSYEDNQFHIVLEKGMLDASLADSEGGISRCHSILGEAARVVRMNGTFVFVSHVNAHSTSGQKWLEDVILPGLFQSCSDCAWSIDVHGNSSPDEDEDISNSNSDSEHDDDENTREEVDEGVDNHPPVEEPNLGPAVYILWKRPLSKDSKLSSTMGDEVSSIDYKYKDFLNHIEIQFFSYEA